MSESIHDIEVTIASPAIKSRVTIDGKDIPVSRVELRVDVHDPFPTLMLYAAQLPDYSPVVITGRLIIDGELPEGLVVKAP